jgi:hypothetical protein
MTLRLGVADSTILYKKTMFNRLFLVTITSVRNYHQNIMSYNMLKKMAQSATPPPLMYPFAQNFYIKHQQNSFGGHVMKQNLSSAKQTEIHFKQ